VAGEREVRGPETPKSLADRMTGLLADYEAAIARRDCALVALQDAQFACDAADETMTACETRIARHLEEMKASARLRVRLAQEGKP
jgi:hypothetical protein